MTLDPSLENFFETQLTPEKYKLYSSIISYLESIEYDTIQDELISLIFAPIAYEDDSIEKPESVICDEVHDRLHVSMQNALLASGVVLHEHVSSSDMFDVCMGIVGIGNYEDTASISAAAYADGDSLDRLSHVLAIVAGHTVDHWAHLLDTVEDDLVNEIVEAANERSNTQYEEMIDTATYLQKLKFYLGFCQERESDPKMFDIVDSVLLGQSLETYINSGRLDDLFEGNEMDKLAEELYGYALMSSDAKNDPPGFIRSIIDKYLGDITRIAQLNAEIAEINAGFTKYYLTLSKEMNV